MTSFIRRVSHYPRFFHPDGQGERNDAFRFARHLALRPGRFIVNNPETKEPDWEIPADFLPSGEAIVAPLRAALYLGRVEDVDPDSKTCFVRVWEVPNGREGTTTLTQEHLAGQDVAIGDTLRIYTWLEVPLSPTGEPLPERPAVRVVVTTRTPLSEEQRNVLKKVLAALTADARPEDEP